MSEELRDSEPMLNEADYQLLVNNDPVLNRMGSNNFASLIESPHNEIIQYNLQYQHQQQINNLQSLDEPTLNVSMFDPDVLPSPLQSESDWLHIESIHQLNEEPCNQIIPEAPIAPLADGNGGNMPSVPDSNATHHIPSLHTWPGQYNFRVFLPAENKDRNKWCFSTEQNKLYLCPNVAVPINVSLHQYIDASITITPVFKESRHRVETVVPCFNCKVKVKDGAEDHLIRVEGQDCDYKEVHGRFVVKVPLYPPPPGEAASTLLLRLLCLTSCIGGPNRRPFSLVFTLQDNTGMVIGRQILDLKCCRCPGRDMLNEDRTALRQRDRSMAQNVQRALKRSASPTTTSGDQKKVPLIKSEPHTQEYVYIKCPAQHERQAKQYINSLASEAYVRKHKKHLLPFSDDEL